MPIIKVKAGAREITLNNELFIDGAFVPAASGLFFPVLNPSNGEQVATVAQAAKADIDKAVAAAKAAFGPWSQLPTTQRADWMNKIAAAMELHAQDLAHLEALDNGKTLKDASGFDVPTSAACIRFYAALADKIEGRTLDTDRDSFDYTIREPIGVCGAIIPLNFPLLMLSWKVGPALATGNTLVLKSSEKTPLSALYFAQLCAQIGLPKGVVNVVSGFGPEAGDPLARHMDVRKIAFTGSGPTGRRVMAAAAESNLKKVSLELGGKSPCIIFNDANVEQAVKWCNIGIFFNHGQCCCASSRFYVQSGIYDQFVQKFAAVAKSKKLGNQFDADTDQGPQVDDIQFKKILGYIEDAKKGGASLAAGGHSVGDKGYFIAPTIITSIPEKNRASKEEIFGPVACVFRFESEEEVLARANNSIYGLAAAVFTKDLDRALRIQRLLDAGTVWINCYNKFDNRMPFGGFKESGFGRELGTESLEQYTQVKAVHVNISGN